MSNNKHFIPPIVQQWIDKLSTEIHKEMYISYLETTRDAIEQALNNYHNKVKKKNN